MKTLVELEKKINSELTTKINNSEIKHNQLYLEIEMLLLLKVNHNQFWFILKITKISQKTKHQRLNILNK